MDKDGYVLGGPTQGDGHYLRYKVWPARSEAVLSKHDGVIEAAVIGIPNPIPEKPGKAFVLRRRASLTEKKPSTFAAIGSRSVRYYLNSSIPCRAIPRGQSAKRELKIRDRETKQVT